MVKPARFSSLVTTLLVPYAASAEYRQKCQCCLAPKLVGYFGYSIKGMFHENLLCSNPARFSVRQDSRFCLSNIFTL